MTRLTPTRTRPDIVTETFKYNRQLALHSHRNEPSLKKQSELFQGDTRGGTKVTAPHSSQWNVALSSVVLYDWLSCVSWLLNSTKSRRSPQFRWLNNSSNLLRLLMNETYITSITIVMIIFLISLLKMSELQWTTYESHGAPHIYVINKTQRRKVPLIWGKGHE